MSRNLYHIALPFKLNQCLVSQTVNISGGPVTFEKHGPPQDCGVKWSKKLENGDVYQQTYGTATEAWVSWHNLGLAADLGQTVVAKNGTVHQNGLPSNNAWIKLTTIFGDLGLTYGGWWGWDPLHIEFHPQMPSPRHIGQSGQPLPDNQLHTGYDWKIPSSIFVYAVDMNNPRANALRVFDLEEDGGYISVKGYRSVEGERDGPWSARWMTFEPAIRLFPAYIPTIRLLRNSGHWPDDAKWDTDTEVELYTYSEKSDSNGKKVWSWSHAAGPVHYRLEMFMWNRQYEANVAYGQSVPLKDTNKPAYDRIRQLWYYLDRTSVYDIDVDAHEDEMKDATVQTRQMGADGYTEDTNTTHKVWLPLPHLGFAWDRDKGNVGAGMVTAVPQNGTYTLTQQSPVSTAQLAVELARTPTQQSQLATIFVSDRLPPGAWDLPEPVAEPPANPRPKDQKKSTGGGFLRP